MRQIFYLGVLLVLIGTGGCNKDTGLAGTKWKLVGIMSDGELKALEPVDCEECYTLTFDTDYKADAHSISNTYKLDILNFDPSIIMEAILIRELYDKDGNYYDDGDIFRRAVFRTASFSNTTDELKLFQYERTDYLIFKKVAL